jgi:lactase-phlorizin hydrolase
MRNTLKWIRDRFNNPDIIVTENGFSDNAGNLDDLMRVYYYKHNINNVLKGMNQNEKINEIK